MTQFNLFTTFYYFQPMILYSLSLLCLYILLTFIFTFIFVISKSLFYIYFCLLYLKIVIYAFYSIIFNSVFTNLINIEFFTDPCYLKLIRTSNGKKKIYRSLIFILNIFLNYYLFFQLFWHFYKAKHKNSTKQYINNELS